MTETPERTAYNAALEIAALRNTVISLAITIVVVVLQFAAYHITDRWWSQVVNGVATVGGVGVLSAVFVYHLRKCAALKRRYLGNTPKT